MSSVLTPTLECSEYTSIKRVRELPIEGEVHVKIGERVSLDKKVLSAELPGELLILRLPERMGLQVLEVLENLKVKEGDTVKNGELLASFSSLFGLLKNDFKAPYSGKIEFISKHAHIGLRLQSKKIEINSYISGKIIDVKEKLAVTVETNACFLQGIFGIGGEQIGELRILECKNDKSLEASDIPDDCSGQILVGGMEVGISALNKAKDKGAKGLVTASLDDRALKEFLGYDLGVAITGDEDISMSLLVTEGFGAIPMSDRIHNMLKKHSGKKCAINGATQVRAGARRPELIIPLEENKDLKAEIYTSNLDINSKVRLIRVPYFGKTGVVKELPNELETIESGAKTRVLRVLLDGEDKIVTIPRANIELL